MGYPGDGSIKIYKEILLMMFKTINKNIEEIQENIETISMEFATKTDIKNIYKIHLKDIDS